MENKYEKEAREKWGDTEAYQQSQERIKALGKEGMERALAETEKITAEIAECMKAGEDPGSEDVQSHIAGHYNSLHVFYEPNIKMYRGLADMYVTDERFKAYYDRVSDGLAEFIRRAMIIYCNNEEA